MLFFVFLFLVLTLSKFAKLRVMHANIVTWSACQCASVPAWFMCQCDCVLAWFMCIRANVSKACERLISTYQHSIRHTSMPNGVTWPAKVPKNVAIFQTFLLQKKNAKGNFCTLLSYKNYTLFLIS